MGDPVYKTILLLDIEKFGPRLQLEQAEAHRVLYSILRQVLAGAAVEQTNTRTEDRGDGVFVLLDASVPKVPVIRALLTNLPTALYDYNRLASESTKIRMRAVVHAGDVEITPDGAVGPAVVDAFRLLNSEKLKEELSRASEPSVLSVTDIIHHDVVRHDHSGIRASQFHQIVADSKEGDRPAWVHRVGQPAGNQVSDNPIPAPAPAPVDSNPQTGPTSGNFFSAGVTVTGDVVGGNKTVNGGGGR